jgi:DNA-binding transcriptional LysR family regulator
MERADLADLTAFVAIADARSFRAAASRLGVTPSALSHYMRQLEELWGCASSTARPAAYR